MNFKINYLDHYNREKFCTITDCPTKIKAIEFFYKTKGNYKISNIEILQSLGDTKILFKSPTKSKLKIYETLRTKKGTFKGVKRISGQKTYSYFDVTKIKNLEDIKKLYYTLAKKLHPDKGGDLVAFQNMQNEYDELVNAIMQGANLSSEQLKNEIELDELYKQAVASLINYTDLHIEVIGTWIWISGNTIPVKQILKDNNFKWAPVKKMWFLDVTGKGTKNKSEMNIDKIRNKYGSVNVPTKPTGKISGTENKNLMFFNDVLKKIKLRLKKRSRYLSKIDHL